MKKFVMRLIIFMGFTVVFYLVMILVAGTYFPPFFEKNFRNNGELGFTEKRLKDAYKYSNVDVLVLGSSHAYRGYDPRIFKKDSLTAFNLGTSAQTPIQSNYLLHKYIKTLNPKFVIVDVYPFLFSIDGVESSVDLVSSGAIDQDAFKMAYDLNNIKLYNSLIYGVFTKYLHLKRKKSTSHEGDQYIPGGYVQSFQRTKRQKLRYKSKIVLSTVQTEAFKRTIAELRSKKIPYVIVQAPFPKSNYNSYTNNAEIDKWLSGLGPYYNFNNILNLPDSMYFDDSHLNQFGVNVFNTALIDTLKAHKFLK